MMSLLVLGWHLSTPVHYETLNLAKNPLPLMDNFNDVLSDTKELLRVCPASDFLSKVFAFCCN